MTEALTPEAAFETLKKNTTEAISAYFPFEGKRRKVEVSNVRVDDKLSSDDIAGQAEAKDREGTWGVPLKADIRLVDKISGKVIDEKKGAVLARLPKMTNRYGFIVNGSEYQVDSLFRLKSGVYAREQENGELESEFNLLKSPTGRNYSIKLDNKNDKFSFKYGEAHIPLYPVMKAMGLSDDDLEHAWGKKLFDKNKITDEVKAQKALQKFWDKTTSDDVQPADLQQYVRNFFEQSKLRPDTTKLTLGKSFENVSPEVLHIAAKKILNVSRNESPPDDRDSLAFKEAWAIEDFIPEKIQRSARTIKSRLRNSVDHKESVGDIISTDLFNRPVQEFFTKGGSITERSEQTNPIQMLSAHRKTTLVAADFGGIKNDNSLTTEMKLVNPSHFGFLDPSHTPESSRTGITLHLAAAVRKNGKDLEAPVFDIHANTNAYVNVPTFHDATVVLPDQVRWEKGKPIPISPIVRVKVPGGAIEHRPYKDAQYVMPSAKGMFDYASNLVPFLPCDQGNRVSMADKQLEQAISLKHREVPLVQSKTDHPTDPNHSFEKILGSFIATKAPISGTVLAVKDSAISIKGVDGKKHTVQYYDHFPTNDPKGMLHSEPSVKVGDKVTKGQTIADNNFTKNGTLAYGTNLRVAYLPFKGYNYEDGVVISETAAKKLTSDHLYKKDLEIDAQNDIVSKAKFQSHAVVNSIGMKKEHLAALGDDGLIKPGTRVEPGQVLVAALGKNMQTKPGAMASMGKRSQNAYRDKSLVWDEDHVGTVTKVVKAPNGKGYKVYVKTDEPAVVGDKMAGRHGNKGIIAKILPDHEMPFTVHPETKEKVPLEVLLSPSGVPTRINVGQMLETAAAKIADKTGKTYVVNNFAGPNHDYRAQVLDDLSKHGLSDEEHVYDPDDIRRPIGSVLVGPQYILKLKHQVEKKMTVRGGGTSVSGGHLPYDINKQPTKGGDHGGQSFGQLEVYALLGHDARHNIREMATYKSDMQDAQFWRAIQEGQEPPPPKAPFSYEKFTTLLKGMGVNVTKEGTSIRLLPMTNKEVLQLADNGKNEIKKGHLALQAKNLKEEPGGIFDIAATGGVDGNKWAYIRLAEPMPNPLFVGGGSNKGPVPALLDLKLKDLEDIISGRQELHGKSGGAAIEHALKQINVHKEIESLRKDLPNLTSDRLDRANEKLKYLSVLKEKNLRPEDAYMLHYMPVIPPKFRPVTLTPQGDINTTSINSLYRHVSLINEQLNKFDSTVFSDDHKAPLRGQLWDVLKALQGVGKHQPLFDSDTAGNRELPGILDLISTGGGEAGQPKTGFFQANLVKRKQNLSIRSTIIPEPALELDEVGLPKNAAMELYKPYVVAQLGKWGFAPLVAQDELKKGTPNAFKALEAVTKDRPLILKRDPALHKYSMLAFRPKLIEGKAIQIHPLVTGPFNADFDGDTMAGTVPMSREAVEEAKKMFPSKNLFSSTTGGVMYTPTQEALLGLHLLSKWGKSSGKKFDSVADLEKAVDSNALHVTDVVHVKGFDKPTTLGRILVESRLPRGFHVSKDILHNEEYKIDKKTLGRDLATVLAKNHMAEYPKIIDSLKDLGNKYSYKLGFSIGLKDLAPLPERAGILAEARKEISHLKGEHGDKDSRIEHERQSVDIWKAATKKMDEAAELRYTKDGNRLAMMVYSGARGKKDQLRQMLAAPMLMQDSTNRTIPTPVTRSYAEGLDIGDYWLAQHGARKGTLQRVQGTQDPGAISKDIMNSTMSTLIVSQDCGTAHGVSMKLKDDDILDRYTAQAYRLKDGTSVPHATLITPEVLSRLKNDKIDEIQVRSPLKCLHGDGICAKCYGLNEGGRNHDLGTNIGVLAGQALGEPAMQMSMDAFHCNHADSVIFARNRNGNGREIAVSLETLFDLVETGSCMEGGEEFKFSPGWEVYDGTWVGMKQIRRHRPDRPMVFVSNGRGGSTICQDNHPVATWKNLVSCPDCQHHTVKKRTGTQNTFCPKCGLRWSPPTDRVGELTFLPPTEIKKGKVFVHTSLHPVLCSQGIVPEYDPYLIGAFVAEGSVRFYAQKGSQTKKPYAVNISQRDGIIKEAIARRIPETWPTSTNKKSITIHSLDLGTDFARMYGRYSRNKALPKEFLQYDDLWLADFVSGLIDGDGTIKNNVDGFDQIVIDTTSYELAQQVMLICQRLDISTGLCLSSRRKLTRHQGFRLSMVVTRKVKFTFVSSLKVAAVRKVRPHYENPPLEQFSRVSEPRPVLYTHDYVYDVTTESGSVYLGGIRTHNSGGTVGSERGAKSVDRFERLSNLLKMPRTLKGEATLATAAGKITAIRPGASGGVEVHIGAVKHLVPEKLHTELLPDSNAPLKVGTEVRKGERLSEGHVNPLTLLSATNNIHAVQNHLTNELYNGLYKNEGVRRRNIEVAVRALTNLAKVKDPGHSSWAHGDVVARSVLEEHNRAQPKGHDPVSFDPILKGVVEIPSLASTDWMQRLNYQRLPSTIQQAAAKGWRSDLHGSAPIPGIAYGAEFGKPPAEVKTKKPHVY